MTVPAQAITLPTLNSIMAPSEWWRPARLWEIIKSAGRSLTFFLKAAVNVPALPFNEKSAYKTFNSLTRSAQHLYNIFGLSAREIPSAINSSIDGVNKLLTWDNPTTRVWHIRHQTRDRLLTAFSWSLKTIVNVAAVWIDAVNNTVNQWADAAAWKWKNGDGRYKPVEYKKALSNSRKTLTSDLKKWRWTHGWFARKPKAIYDGNFSPSHTLHVWADAYASDPTKPMIKTLIPVHSWMKIAA